MVLRKILRKNDPARENFRWERPGPARLAKPEIYNFALELFVLFVSSYEEMKIKAKDLRLTLVTF